MRRPWMETPAPVGPWEPSPEPVPCAWGREDAGASGAGQWAASRLQGGGLGTGCSGEGVRPRSPSGNYYFPRGRFSSSGCPRGPSAHSLTVNQGPATLSPPPPRTKWQPGGTGGGCHSPPAAPGSSVHLGLWLGSQRNCRLGKRGGAAPPPNHLPAWWERPWAPPGQARRPDNGDQTLGALGGDGGLGGQRPLTGSPDWWCL